MKARGKRQGASTAEDRMPQNSAESGQMNDSCKHHGHIKEQTQDDFKHDTNFKRPPRKNTYITPFFKKANILSMAPGGGDDVGIMWRSWGDEGREAHPADASAWNRVLGLLRAAA